MLQPTSYFQKKLEATVGEAKNFSYKKMSILEGFANCGCVSL